MTRVTENSMARSVLNSIMLNKQEVDKTGQEVSSGIKVNFPGDSEAAGTISSYQEALRRVQGHEERITSVQSFLSYQDNIVSEASQVMVRAKEIATQGANEVHSQESRPLLAEEVFQLRDEMVALANSVYQGKYVYGGAADNNPPFNKTVPYTTPAAGGAATDRYIFAATPGITNTRSVNVTDSLSVTVNTPGDQVFADAITTLEHLGRALSGYTTNPDGTYTLPDQLNVQTKEIAGCIDEVQSVISNDLTAETTKIAGKQRRLTTALTILKAAKSNGEEVINNLQNVDMTEAASALSQAQTALQASYVVSSRVLDMTIMSYL